MEDQFSCIKTRNCRRFHKRTYTLAKEIDNDLVDSLQKLGVLEIIKFSDYLATARDIFKVRIEDLLEISGTFNDRYLQITLRKDLAEMIIDIEGKINSWSLSCSQSESF